MAQIVCISYIPWRSAPSRSQELLSHIPEAEVLFFQPASSRRADAAAGRQVLPNITVYPLPASLYLAEARPRTYRKALDFIQHCMDAHSFEEPLLWACTPMAANLMEELPCRGLVYDCDRIWQELPVSWESNLAYRADLILAASPGLEERLSLCNDNIACIPPGVDFPLFSMVGQTRLPFPADLKPLTILGPVLGYLGPIDARLNLTPVLTAAQAHPDWQFVFIGKCHPRNPFLRKVKALENIHLLGSRPSAVLPDYISRFDVCFDLLHATDPEDDVIPSRIYAYLLSGKPMVVMHLRYATPIFPDVVHNAETSAEFLQQCEKALGEQNHWARGRRKKYGATAAWANRYRETCELLDVNGLI